MTTDDGASLSLVVFHIQLETWKKSGNSRSCTTAGDGIRKYFFFLSLFRLKSRSIPIWWLNLQNQQWTQRETETRNSLSSVFFFCMCDSRDCRLLSPTICPLLVASTIHARYPTTIIVNAFRSLLLLLVLHHSVIAVWTAGGILSNSLAIGELFSLSLMTTRRCRANEQKWRLDAAAGPLSLCW